MKLNLTTWQRIMAVQALNAQAGHISLIRKALKLLDILELSAEEAQAVKLRELPEGGFGWEDLDRRFELEVKDRELASHLGRAVRAYDRWPVGQAKAIVDLFTQLGIEEAVDENL